jgi:hypothetical protein
MLALERRIVESIRAPRDNVEQSPHAGWQKLSARLDQDSTQPHVRPASNATSRPAQDSQPRHSAPATVSDLAHASATATRPRRANWSVVLGAAVAVQAAAIAVLAVALVRHHQVEEAPRFHTVANADPTLAASGPLVRIAFDSTVNETAARGVASGANGRILAGPSPENVYTFVFQPASNLADGAAVRPQMDDVVNGLRRQPHVLLVEPVVLGQSSDKRR